MFSLAIVINTACENKTIASKEINFKLDSLSVNGKAIIEQNLAKENGVIFVKAHLRKQVVTIVYDTTIESKDKLVGALEKMGYKTELTGNIK
jgi:copper chaperone CopZ